MASNLNPGELAALSMLGASLHYVLARAEVTEPLWSQATGRLARLMACAACSGFWICGGLGIFGLRPYSTGLALGDVLVSALLGVFVVPIAEGALLWGLERTALDVVDEDAAARAAELDDLQVDASSPPTPPAA